MQSEATKHGNLKEKAIAELKEFWMIALYLFVFFGAFTFYRRMITAEFGVTYLHYGVALIEALVIAKVVLIGRALGLGREAARGRLIVSVVFNAFVFAVLSIMFGVLEHVVDGLIHKKDWASIMHDLLAVGPHELFARLIMMFVSFLPFFAFLELGRALGSHRLLDLFLAKRGPELTQP